MTSACELLRIILKTIGFWSLVSGIAGLPQAVSFAREYPDGQSFVLMMADTFVGPGILIAVSWFLIRSTDWFVAIAQPGTSGTGGENSTPSSRELLRVALIALGYMEILNGTVRLPYEFAKMYRASWGASEGFAYAGISIVAGCFLVFATDWCVRFAYQNPARVDDDM